MDDGQLDLRRFIGPLLTWWWVLLLGALAGGLLALFISARQTPIYEASSTILVQQTQSALPTISDIQTSQSLAVTYKELITTRPVLEAVSRELGLSISAGSLKGATSVSVVRDTQLLRLTVRHPVPQTAADIADTLAQVFIQQTTDDRLLMVARLQQAAAAQGITDQSGLVTAQLAALGVLSQVEEALIPSTPVLPRTQSNMLIAVVLGLVIGIAVIIFVENLMDTVRSPEQLEVLFGLSHLGVIPAWRNREVIAGQVITAAEPQSVFAEGYRQVRANIEFAGAGRSVAVLLVTSAAQGEGKSSAVVNLAATLSQQGKTVLLVDADLRRPELHRFFGLRRDAPGLSSYLAMPENTAVAEMIQDTNIPGVRVLGSGPRPPNPAELLGLPRMKALLDQLRREVDIVIVDSAPLLVAVDSMILSSIVEGVVLIVESEHTRIGALRVATENLKRTEARVLGVVLNKLKPKKFSYGYRYPYYYYYSYYYARYYDEEDVDRSMDAKRGRWSRFRARIHRGWQRMLRRNAPEL